MSKQSAAKQVMPIITVESVDKARNFYVETLGFDHVMGVLGKDGQLDFLTVVLGGARLMFSRPQGAGAAASAGGKKQPVEIYFQVGDVEAYHASLKKRGVKITEGLTTQWWGDRTFKLMDPYGYEIWFYQTVGEPKPPQGMKIV
jgi:PhnB protein